MRLLVTRPAEASALLAARLEALGHTVAIEPLMIIRLLPHALPALDGIAALIFTSANGARAFAAASPRRDLAAYAVGASTAETLKEAGFGALEIAGGDSAALARLVIERRRPEEGALLHVAGTEVAGDLAGTLGQAGFAVARAVLYEAEAVSALSPGTAADLAAGKIDGVLLYSPRTARLFAARLAEAGLGAAGRHLTAWCLSPAVAEALADTPITDRRIAERPTEDALLARIGNAMVSSPSESDPRETEKEDAVSVTPPPSPAIEAPSPAPDAPPAAPQRHDRSIFYIGGAVVLLALIAGVGATFWWPRPPQFMPQPSPPPAPGSFTTTTEATPPADEALRQEVDALSQRLNALADRPAADQSAVEGVASTEQKLDATLGTLTTRVNKLEAEIAAIDRSAAADKALILAIGDLRLALAGSGPYDASVGVIGDLAGNDAALGQSVAVLRRHAGTGLPSVALLGDRLAALAPAIESAPDADNAAPWWRRYLLDPILRLVRISRVPENGDVQAMPPGPDRVVAEAGVALKAGDLPGAVRLIESLTDGAAETLGPWLAEARARLDAEAAAARLAAAATRRLGVGGGP